jgi:hypothetical protein
MENIPNMTKSTFEIKTDAKSGLRYVTKAKDELTKNHRGTDKEENCWHNAWLVYTSDNLHFLLKVVMKVPSILFPVARCNTNCHQNHRIRLLVVAINQSER